MTAASAALHHVRCTAGPGRPHDRHVYQKTINCATLDAHNVPWACPDLAAPAARDSLRKRSCPMSDQLIGLTEIEVAHERAFAALDGPSESMLDAVVWLSAHLAAVQHVVRPAASRVLGDAPAIKAMDRGAVRLERTLRSLEQFASGDALAAGTDAGRLTRELTRSVGAQADREHAILRRLGDVLTPQEQADLVAAYRRALEQAPTRPHPHTPHAGRVGALAFWVNARRDRVMDTLDARHVPTPHRARAQVKTGRWSDYLLGRRSPDSSD